MQNKMPRSYSYSYSWSCTVRVCSPWHIAHALSERVPFDAFDGCRVVCRREKSVEVASRVQEEMIRRLSTASQQQAVGVHPGHSLR